MFEEIITILWTCDICGNQVIKYSPKSEYLIRPTDWCASKLQNTHSMFEANKDICDECKVK